MMTESQRSVVRSLKGLGPGDGPAAIDIRDDEGRWLGTLRPVDATLARDPAVVDGLTRWRQKFMRYFLTQFEATDERTASWLQNVVLAKDDRILFLICDETGKPVGNFGVCNIAAQSAELDNLIRGEKGGDARLVFFSEVCLMRWIYRALGVEEIYLHVFSNNARTRALHQSVGFTEVNTYRLTKTERPGELHYTIDHDAAPDGDEFGLTRMTIDKDVFLSTYGA